MIFKVIFGCYGHVVCKPDTFRFTAPISFSMRHMEEGSGDIGPLYVNIWNAMAVIHLSKMNQNE